MTPEHEDCPMGGKHRLSVFKTWAVCSPCHKTWWRCDPVRGPQYEGEAFVPVHPPREEAP